MVLKFFNIVFVDNFIRSLQLIWNKTQYKFLKILTFQWNDQKYIFKFQKFAIDDECITKFLIQNQLLIKKIEIMLFMTKV
jgi:hypothetical protein